MLGHRLDSHDWEKIANVNVSRGRLCPGGRAQLRAERPELPAPPRGPREGRGPTCRLCRAVRRRPQRGGDPQVLAEPRAPEHQQAGVERAGGGPAEGHRGQARPPAVAGDRRGAGGEHWRGRAGSAAGGGRRGSALTPARVWPWGRRSLRSPRAPSLRPAGTLPTPPGAPCASLPLPSLLSPAELGRSCFGCSRPFPGFFRASLRFPSAEVGTEASVLKDGACRAHSSEGSWV